MEVINYLTARESERRREKERAIADDRAVQVDLIYGNPLRGKDCVNQTEKATLLSSSVSQSNSQSVNQRETKTYLCDKGTSIVVVLYTAPSYSLMQ